MAGAACALAIGLVSAGSASAKPIYMPTITREIQQQGAARAINPPPAPCPQFAVTSCTPVPETPATTLPYPGNMAYYGGPVQVHAKEYLVYWGWGEHGAFPGQQCSSETITEGALSATLACDPDLAGKYMADFVAQMGGTGWAGVSAQYFQGSGSSQQPISNDPNVLGGIWVDDSNDITGLPNTNANNPPGSTNTYTDLAAEAQRAVAHFGVTDLNNANIIVIQPPAYSDPNAISQGYCAFHDYTYPNVF